MPVNKIWLIISALLLAMIIYVLWPTSEYEVVVEEPLVNHMEVEAVEEPMNETKTVFVDVKGEVFKPGVYEMTEGDRVIDVIEVAGGFKKDADQISVNLAMLLRDEMVIFVPRVGEQVESDVVSHSNNNGQVRINTASKEELMTIPGIGEQKALAIIEYREKQGYFRQVEDLLQISGIGEKTLERIAEYIIVP